MNSHLLFNFTFLLLIGCEEARIVENNCHVKDPAKELEWLKKEIDALALGYDENPTLYQYFYITQAELKGETVFIFGNCCPFCGSIIPVRNCDGDLLGYMGTNSELTKISNETILWQPPDFACNL
jgi:hypothetical protein